jgi:hypothetical protein
VLAARAREVLAARAREEMLGCRFGCHPEPGRILDGGEGSAFVFVTLV